MLVFDVYFDVFRLVLCIQNVFVVYSDDVFEATCRILMYFDVFRHVFRNPRRIRIRIQTNTHRIVFVENTLQIHGEYEVNTY